MAKGDFGYNGVIASKGLGRQRIRVTRLVRKVSQPADHEADGRRRRAFYPQIVTSSGFTIEIAFFSYEERGRFNNWLRTYMERVVDGTAPSGTVTVSIPHRNLVQVCVPEADLDYGEGVGDIYTLTMGFIGASDPINLDLGARQAGVSYFVGPKNNTIGKYFYPAGQQVSGAESLDGTIFDTSSAPGVVGAGGIDRDTDTGYGPQEGVV